ncbi:hypothetical protein Sm713_67770 [Streptomyces sp. TS71-3]|nr:hypothetical protein [Streptomyces sp. TS71-3]GHJ41168.1 hypothetical protein Sm713_67770 [Streptomyces sp. TS71-3]
MYVPFDVSVEEFVEVEFGVLAGHEMQFDAVGVLLQPGVDGLAVVDRVPLGDDVDLAAGLAASRPRKAVNTFAVKRPVKTVNHSAPREAMPT